MPPFDREGALKSAEQALRRGSINDAIAEYEGIVEELPGDWNSANALGDLYMRAGQTDWGIAEYKRIADALDAAGDHRKAAALLTKIRKVWPEGDYALLQSRDIHAKSRPPRPKPLPDQTTAMGRGTQGDRSSSGAGVGLEARFAKWLSNMGKTASAKTVRRVMLGTGVVLFVMNILPTSFRGAYYWTWRSSLLAGIGAALAVMAIATKPKDETF